MSMGKRERQKAERPREILEAALEEFFQKGYRATRVDDIAARVGVTKGTVYFYFETKEKLFTEVIRHFTPQLNPPNNPETGDSAEKQLLSYIRFLYSNVAAERTSRELFHLIISEGHHFPDFLDTHFAEFLEPALIRVREILCRGVETGEFRSSRVESFPEIILGPTVLLNIWLVVFGDRKPIDQDMFIDTHLDLLVGGLRVHAASPTREPQG